MIRFGQYTRKVTFISYGDNQDGYGGSNPIVENILETFADVKQLRGSNDLEAAQLELPKTYLCRVQARSGFEPNTSMQILYDDLVHVIKGVTQKTERNRMEYLITMVRTSITESPITPSGGIGAMIIESTFIVG